MGKIFKPKTPKLDNSVLIRQQKEAAEERRRLEQERVAAETERKKIEVDEKNRKKIRNIGRTSLITNIGGELGTKGTLG